MAAILTTEQRDLAEAVADLLAKRSPEAEVRRLMADDAGYDPALWTELAEMGLLGWRYPRSTAAPAPGRPNSAWSWSRWARRCCVRRICPPRY